MNSETDIAKLLMMEMEKEVKNAEPQVASVPKTSTNFPLFQLSSMHDNHPQEDDAIQSEIEQRLRRKQEERQLHGNATQIHSQDIRGHLVNIQPQNTNDSDDVFENTSESHQQHIEGGVEHLGDNGEELHFEAEEQMKREAEEQMKREAEEQMEREAEEQMKREAEEQMKREAEEQMRREAEEQMRREAEGQMRRETQECGQQKADEEMQCPVEERSNRDAVSKTMTNCDVLYNAVKSSSVVRREVSTTLKIESGYKQSNVKVEESDESIAKESLSRSLTTVNYEIETDDADDDKSETVSDTRSFASTVCGGVQNDNGILGTDSFEIRDGVCPSVDTFEEFFAHECFQLGLNEDTLQRQRIERHQYETIREPGRCLYPADEVRSDVTLTANIQLGFFRSKQEILTGVSVRQKRVAERERRAGSGQRELSSVHCYFENELLQDTSVTFDDENLPHNAPGECIITEQELVAGSPTGSVSHALGLVTFGDPIQVWERACGHSFDLTIRSVKGRPTVTHTDGLTTGMIWSNGIDTQKPTTAVSIFSGGALIQVECVKLSNPMFEIHGNAVDPILVAAAFYSVSENIHVKVSETFFFGSSIDIFYPHKERKELQRENRSIVFIPQEFLSSLYMVTRVYRPASEDFDEYLDLYTRPDRYKNHHVAPMKEKTQLLAMSSDALEEMGWNFVRCSGKNGKPLRTLEVKKLFRKQIDDAQMYGVIDNDRSWSSMVTLPFDMEFSLTDCSNHDVAFPSQYINSRPEENETMVSLLNPDVPGALSEICRYVPCAIPILNSGFFHAYHNVFYFRLAKIRVTNAAILRKIPLTHRTFVVHICVKDQDASLAEDGLPLIYGNRLSGQTLETSAWSSTVHASPDFNLSDEFKIQLPLHLTDNHHIFLTLYASHQRKNPSVEGQQRLYKVGHAAFPISRHGVVQVKEGWPIPFVSADQATVIAAGGYLSKFPDAPVSALLNNGASVVLASTQARTSVHASNRTIASVFCNSPPSLQRITEDDDVLAVSGQLNTLNVTIDDEVHSKVTALIRLLPLAEILAFYPYLCFYSLALVSSPSRRVSLGCRTAALDALIDITFKVQQYDANSQLRRQSNPSSHVYGFHTVPHTSVTSVLYHYLTNDVLYSGKVYRLYAGVAEVWLHLLAEANSGRNDHAEGNDVNDAQPTRENARTSTRNMKKQMADLSWFLFDVILRSIYLWALDNPKVPRTQLLDAKFYDIAGRLCVQVLYVLRGFVGDGVLVSRVALFVRNLSNFGDRGRVLRVHKRVMEMLEQQGEADSLCTYLRLVLDAPDVLTLMLPSPSHSDPIFLTRMVVKSLSPLIVHKERATRAEAGAILYNFLCRLSNNSRVTSSSLRLVAAQLFPLLTAVAEQWKTFVNLCDKSEERVAVYDKRQVVVAMLWIVYYLPRGTLRRWLHSASNGRGISGLMSIAGDAQSLLRYNQGTGKANPKASTSSDAELREWDARMSTFAAAIGARLCSIFLEDIPHVLRMVKSDKIPPAVFNYFVLLESVVSLGQSTLALQFGASVLFETVRVLFPEIASRAARMSGGMVLLGFRLMSSCCQYVRGIAGRSFLLMCQSLFSWTGSLARIKSLTANALVSVAESKARSLRLAGRFIEFQLDDLLGRAREEEAHFVLPEPDYSTRYDRDLNQSGGDSGAKYQYRVASLFLSVTPQFPKSRYLLERCGTGSDGNQCAAGQLQQQLEHNSIQGKNNSEAVLQFSSEFAALSDTALGLFRDVLRLQMDSSMKFKEARIFAYFEVFRNFLRQNALNEVLKWLRRLHSAHKADSDMAEAGMVLIFSAALCFRITEVFYLMRGHKSRGARMPAAVLTHVFWHDYVRLLPELEMFLHPDTVCTIVSELHICPEDPLFSIEGQVKALKEAAEYLERDEYYEFSIRVASIADKYLRAIGDFKSASAVHNSMSTWCKAIARTGKRHNDRYFLLWARMERAEPIEKRREPQHEGEDTMLGEQPHGLPGRRAIKRVHKMPPTSSLEDFTDYAKSYVATFFEDPSLVVVTDDLSDTLPALPDPTSRKKRVAAMHRPPNHCWVTVFEVHASFSKGEPIPPDGFDRAMHIQKFENIMHVRPKADGANNSKKVIDLMNHHMSINTYTLERAFPSTTSAIDVSETSEVLLDPFQTAQEMIGHRIDIMKQAPENDTLITVLRDALSPMGILPPGAYMKEIITTMTGYPDIILSVKSISALARKKLLVCEKLDVMTKAPDDYALVLKAVTDIECCLIAMEEAPLSGVDQDD